MPRKRASQERREREKLIRSALRQAAKRVQQRRVEFRPEGAVPVVDAAEAEQSAIDRSDPQAVSEITDEDLLQIDGREFDNE